MKKTTILIILCVAFIIVGMIPAVISLSERYVTLQFNKEIDTVFTKAFSEELSVKGINNESTYIIPRQNATRIYEIMTYTKRHVKNPEIREDYKYISIDIYDTATIEITNFDNENDIALVRIIKVGEKTSDWFMISGLRFYEQMNDIVDDDGYLVPNKRIGK